MKSGIALGDQLVHLGERVVGDVAHDHVEAVVDDGVALGLGVPRVEAGAQALALRLDREVHDARRPAERRRARPGLERVLGERAAERQLHVRVDVDRARDHVLARRVDGLVGGHPARRQPGTRSARWSRRPRGRRPRTSRRPSRPCRWRSGCACCLLALDRPRPADVDRVAVIVARRRARRRGWCGSPLRRGTSAGLPPRRVAACVTFSGDALRRDRDEPLGRASTVTVAAAAPVLARPSVSSSAGAIQGVLARAVPASARSAC